MDGDQMVLRLKNDVQKAEIISDLNQHGAKQAKNSSNENLDDEYLADHYISSGRADQITDLFSDETFWAAGKALKTNPRLLAPLECLQALWDVYHRQHPEVEPPLALLQPQLLSSSPG